MVVAEVALRDFRSYARQELELGPGLTMVVGPNGAGKTNLLEGIHVATQGYSLRTRHDARAVRYGAAAARVSARGTRDDARPFATEVTIERGDGKRILLDGAPVLTADELRRALPALAFTPDRLAIVKGAPLVRRTYLDRMIPRLIPTRAAVPSEYAGALAQRNAALRRVRAGFASRAAIAPWTEALAHLGVELDRARSHVVAALALRFGERAEGLGLVDGAIGYAGGGLSIEELDARLERDLERGTTGVGPHLRDVAVTAGDRELRIFGSQGEQRLAVLALLLAEADALTETRGAPPLLLLDDVLSELDDRRRGALLAGLPPGAQTLVTATSLRSLPPDAAEPAFVIAVSPGRAEVR